MTAVGIGEYGTQQQRAGARIDADRREVDPAFVRIAGLVGQPGQYRHRPGAVVALAGLLLPLADTQQIELVDREVDVDRIDLVDLGERRLLAAGAHDVADVDKPSPHATVERRRHLRVADVQIGEVDLRLGVGERRSRRIALKAPIIDVGGSRRLLLEQARVSVEFGLCIEQRRLLGLYACLRLRQLRLALLAAGW